MTTQREVDFEIAVRNTASLARALEESGGSLEYLLDRNLSDVLISLAQNSITLKAKYHKPELPPGSAYMKGTIV